jgi:hypothetical protein
MKREEAATNMMDGVDNSIITVIPQCSKNTLPRVRIPVCLRHNSEFSPMSCHVIGTGMMQRKFT